MLYTQNQSIEFERSGYPEQSARSDYLKQPARSGYLKQLERLHLRKIKWEAQYFERTSYQWNQIDEINQDQNVRLNQQDSQINSNIKFKTFSFCLALHYCWWSTTHYCHDHHTGTVRQITFFIKPSKMSLNRRLFMSYLNLIKFITLLLRMRVANYLYWRKVSKLANCKS